MTSTPPANDTPSLLKRLDGAQVYSLTLTNRWSVSPSIIGLRLEGNLDTLDVLPGNDMMFSVPLPASNEAFRRRYSIRTIQKDQGTLDLWIDHTAAGPGSTWATTAQLGSTVEAIGPRGQVTLDQMADWHLFVGDLSFLPAAYAMAESIDPPGQALFVFEISDPDDAIVPSLDDYIGVTVCFVERGGRSVDDPSGLIASLEALEFPRDLGHTYIGGELSVVARIKAHLTETGFVSQEISAKPYWRNGVANMAHGEPKKDR